MNQQSKQRPLVIHPLPSPQCVSLWERTAKNNVTHTYTPTHPPSHSTNDCKKITSHTHTHTHTHTLSLTPKWLPKIMSHTHMKQTCLCSPDLAVTVQQESCYVLDNTWGTPVPKSMLLSLLIYFPLHSSPVWKFGYLIFWGPHKHAVTLQESKHSMELWYQTQKQNQN